MLAARVGWCCHCHPCPAFGIVVLCSALLSCIWCCCPAFSIGVLCSALLSCIRHCGPAFGIVIPHIHHYCPCIMCCPCFFVSSPHPAVMPHRRPWYSFFIVVPIVPTVCHPHHSPSLSLVIPAICHHLHVVI
ncbi:hypothetical protein L208DRAFT_1470762 [Tricholoma matsutake]|nr:hypothetical protein L208DRAFT_1470762 [Tricholoma matsutake 945]